MSNRTPEGGSRLHVNARHLPPRPIQRRICLLRLGHRRPPLAATAATRQAHLGRRAASRTHTRKLFRNLRNRAIRDYYRTARF